MIEKTKASIIEWSGWKQNGKDTGASFLIERLKRNIPGIRIMEWHFGDPLKLVGEKGYGYNGNKMDPEQRAKLQYIGEKVRSNRPDGWVNIAKEIILGLDGDWDLFIIPDWRYPNERDVLRDITDSLLQVRVLRPNYEGNNDATSHHTSEHSLPESPDSYDNFFINDGTLEEYKRRIENFADALCYERDFFPKEIQDKIDWNSHN